LKGVFGRFENIDSEVESSFSDGVLLIIRLAFYHTSHSN
jgi:hypothetical protein